MRTLKRFYDHHNLVTTDTWLDLISGREVRGFDRKLKLKPYQCVWLNQYREAEES